MTPLTMMGVAASLTPDIVSVWPLLIGVDGSITVLTARIMCRTPGRDVENAAAQDDRAIASAPDDFQRDTTATVKPLSVSRVNLEGAAGNDVVVPCTRPAEQAQLAATDIVVSLAITTRRGAPDPPRDHRPIVTRRMRIVAPTSIGRSFRAVPPS